MQKRGGMRKKERVFFDKNLKTFQNTWFEVFT